VDAMEQGDQEGMQTFDGVIEKMIRSGLVKMEDAMPYATNQNNLLLRLADFAGAPPPAPTAAAAAPPRREEPSMLDMIER